MVRNDKHAPRIGDAKVSPSHGGPLLPAGLRPRRPKDHDLPMTSWKPFGDLLEAFPVQLMACGCRLSPPDWQASPLYAAAESAVLFSFPPVCGAKTNPSSRYGASSFVVSRVALHRAWEPEAVGRPKQKCSAGSHVLARLLPPSAAVCHVTPVRLAATGQTALRRLRRTRIMPRWRPRADTSATLGPASGITACLGNSPWPRDRTVAIAVACPPGVGADLPLAEKLSPVADTRPPVEPAPERGGRGEVPMRTSGGQSAEYLRLPTGGLETKRCLRYSSLGAVPRVPRSANGSPPLPPPS